MKAKPLDQTQSKAWKARAEKRVPVMSQTFSKAPMCFPQGSYPAFLQSGKGCRVTDVDGHEYIDWILALGPVVLGYADPAVDAAVRAQLERGITFSLPHPLEVEVAELLHEVIPCAEMARFSKTGSEVTSAAVRAARAFTGREKIAYGSYHGWHDWYSVTTSRDTGIPRANKELMVPFNFNDLPSLHAALKKHEGEIAAVILEPVTLDEPAPGFLEELIATAHRAGALVIFDEIVTGFRIALGGAQERYRVKPDLATFGKGMANGMPLAAVVGRGDVMRKFEDAFFSTTFGGEALSLAAAAAAVREFRRLDVAAHLWSTGEALKAAFERAARSAGVDGKAWGPGPHFVMLVKDASGQQTPEVKSLFLQECVRCGVLRHVGAINICHAHGPAEVEATERAMTEALKVVGTALREDRVRQMLDGEPYSEVFRRNL
jgi:glutamate-1-semialdehyde aminotransferase